MMSEPIILSHASIKDWNTCRQLWYNKRVRKLRKKTPALPLKRGEIIHALLESWLVGEDWKPVLQKYEEQYSQLLEEEQEYYGDLPGECKRLFKAYARHWKKDPIKTLATEISFGPDREDTEVDHPPVEIAPGVFLEGKIDWLFEVQEGPYTGVWIGEHKTTKSKWPSEGYRLFDLQTVLYTIVLPSLCPDLPEPRGVCFDYLKTKPPSEPQKLVRGGVSRAKRALSGTDYHTYKKAILAVGDDPADYKNELAVTKRNVFFERKYLPKPDQLVSQLLTEVQRIAEEIPVLKDKPYRNLRRECEMCEFYDLCTAELLELDVDFILKKQYTERKGVKNEKSKEKARR